MQRPPTLTTKKFPPLSVASRASHCVAITFDPVGQLALQRSERISSVVSISLSSHSWLVVTMSAAPDGRSFPISTREERPSH